MRKSDLSGAKSDVLEFYSVLFDTYKQVANQKICSSWGKRYYFVLGKITFDIALLKDSQELKRYSQSVTIYNIIFLSATSNNAL